MSSEASACPTCGTKRPKRLRIAAWITLALVLVATGFPMIGGMEPHVASAALQLFAPGR
jgi:hypothetical protein